MYRAVIVEDNEILRKVLFLLIKKTAPFQVQVVGFSENVDESVELIENLKPEPDLTS